MQIGESELDVSMRRGRHATRHEIVSILAWIVRLCSLGRMILVSTNPLPYLCDYHCRCYFSCSKISCLPLFFCHGSRSGSSCNTPDSPFFLRLNRKLLKPLKLKPEGAFGHHICPDSATVEEYQTYGDIYIYLHKFKYKAP